MFNFREEDGEYARGNINTKFRGASFLLRVRAMCGADGSCYDTIQEKHPVKKADMVSAAACIIVVLLRDTIHKLYTNCT